MAGADWKRIDQHPALLLLRSMGFHRFARPISTTPVLWDGRAMACYVVTSIRESTWACLRIGMSSRETQQLRLLHYIPSQPSLGCLPIGT